MDNPLGSKEQRERHREAFLLSHRGFTNLQSLDVLAGLDIAEERLYVALEKLLQEAWADADVHPRHGYGTCARCDKFWDDSIAALAAWDKWKGERNE